MRGRIDARVIVSYVLSFVLSLIFLCESALVAVEIGFFNQNGFMGLVGRDYCAAVYEELSKSLKSYTIPTGIDAGVVEGIFGIDDLTSDLNGWMYSTFEGSEYTPDLTRMDEALRANVKASFEGQELENQDEIIDAFVEDINGIYVSGLKIPLLKYIIKARTIYDRYFLPALIILTGVAMVIGTFLMMMYRRKYKGLRYIAYAAGAAAVMCFCVPFGILASGVYKNLILMPQYFYELTTGYIRNALMTCLGVALFWVIIVVLLVAIAGSLKKRRVM